MDDDLDFDAAEDVATAAHFPISLRRNSICAFWKLLRLDFPMISVIITYLSDYSIPQTDCVPDEC